MAKFNVVGMEDVERALLRQEAIAEQAVPEMLIAGGEILRKAFYDAAVALNHTGRGTGDLAKSIQVSAVRGDGTGRYVDVAPTGTDRHGVRNATKGFVLEYGRKNMHPYPWFSTGRAKAQDAVLAEMRRVWEGYVNGGK